MSSDLQTWNAWYTVHQPYELDYHLKEGIAWCEDNLRFMDFWQRIFDFIFHHGHTPNPFAGNVLDIGCGPRPPMRIFFPLARNFCIDPLADEYKKHTPESWWRDITSYPIAAEHRADELVGKMDMVLCWNCLDHTIDWKVILQNIASYGHAGTLFAIATDFNPPNIGHPGFDRQEFIRELGKYFVIYKEALHFQERDNAWVMRKL